MQNDLTIGKLAKAGGVNVETIRYYQRLGLIREPLKPLDGYRLYPEDDIDKLHFIKRAQGIGFSLKDIKQLFALGEDHCGDVQTLAKQKRIVIDHQINELMNIRDVLDQLIEQCNDTRPDNHCALIDVLKKDCPRTGSN